MHRRFVAIAMAPVLSLSAAGSLQAAPPRLFPHTHAEKPAAGKLISFKVRNDSKTTLLLKAGEHEVSVEPGKTVALKLQEGSEVVAVESTPTHPAGSVLAKVGQELQGNTLAVS